MDFCREVCTILGNVDFSEKCIRFLKKSMQFLKIRCFFDVRPVLAWPVFGALRVPGGDEWSRRGIKKITTRKIYSAKYQPNKHQSVSSNFSFLFTNFSRTEQVFARCFFWGAPFFRTLLLYYDGISYNGKNRSSPTYLDSEINQKIRLGKTAFSHHTAHYLAKMHLHPRPHERAFGCTEPVRIANQQNTEF